MCVHLYHEQDWQAMSDDGTELSGSVEVCQRCHKTRDEIADEEYWVKNPHKHAFNRKQIKWVTEYQSTWSNRPYMIHGYLTCDCGTWEAKPTINKKV